MRVMALILFATAIAGCEADEEDDDLDDVIDDDGGGNSPDTTLWTASIAGTQGFESIAGDATVQQDFGSPAFTVTLIVRGDDPGAVRPWHVHVGSCADGGEIVGDPTAYIPLTIGDAGATTTTARVSTPLDPRVPYHLNIHLSPSQLSVLIACGDLLVSAR